MSFRNEKYPNVFKMLLIINSALSTPPIKTAFVKYKENEEVATACGLDLGELAQELLNREHLRCKLEELKKVF